MDRPKTLFVIQPMAGKTKEQIMQERNDTLRKLDLSSCTVLENYFDVYPPEGTPTHLTLGQTSVYAFSTNIQRMAMADMVIVMPGWENAKGCIIEYEIARHYGLNVREVLELGEIKGFDV